MPEDVTTGASTSDTIKITPVRSDRLLEFHVSAVPTKPQADAATQTRTLYTALLKQLDEVSSLRIVAERVFGSLDAKDAFLATRREVLSQAGVPTDTPVTYLEGTPVDGEGLAGVQMTLVRNGASGVEVSPLIDGGVTYGYVVTVGDVRRVFLPGMHGLMAGESDVPQTVQARRMFERTNRLLTGAGLDYRKVVLTRIYLKDILDWYGEFNVVRNPFHEEVGLSRKGRHQPPASTGIQGKLSDACACFMDVTAIANGSECPFTRLVNPLQNEATDYGSSFARAVEVPVPDAAYVLVSGTASIDETGATVHLDDPRLQTIRTMRNFEAVLGAGGATLDNLYHAVWYCKEARFAGIVREEMRRQHWPDFPFVTVVADVCRRDLLVEIDGAAVVAR